jgi:hypothetical protein
VSLHVFVDESKVDDYVVVSARLHTRTLNAARGTLRALLLPNQRRIHMRTERVARKHLIMRELSKLDIQASAYVTKNDRGARERCLMRLVNDLRRRMRSDSSWSAMTRRTSLTSD